MTTPNNKPRDPIRRFRDILSNKDKSETVDRPFIVRKKVNAVEDHSPIERLPKANSGLTPLEALPPEPSPEPKPARRSLDLKRFAPAFWTIASVISLTMNLVLIVGLLILLQVLGAVRATGGNATTNLVSGLYTNFEKMDQAHIRTTIPVNTNVPVTLNVCIKSGTNVILNRDTNIPNARVTVQTGGLNIVGATTTIALPANTVLPVNLDLCVPVNTTIPVALNVNVDIPIASTELHPAILGLEQTIQPLYCLLQPNAVSAADGAPVCK